MTKSKERYSSPRVLGVGLVIGMVIIGSFFVFVFLPGMSTHSMSTTSTYSTFSTSEIQNGPIKITSATLNSGYIDLNIENLGSQTLLFYVQGNVTYQGAFVAGVSTQQGQGQYEILPNAQSNPIQLIFNVPGGAPEGLGPGTYNVYFTVSSVPNPTLNSQIYSNYYNPDMTILP